MSFISMYYTVHRFLQTYLMIKNNFKWHFVSLTYFYKYIMYTPTQTNFNHKCYRHS